MKRITFTTLLLLLPGIIILSQTVVKMEMPAQSEEPVMAETLFDESLPLDIPTVLGPMGYDVKGGTPPYNFHWFEGENNISNYDIVTITPIAGNNYTVKISDRNNCSVTLTISISDETLKSGSPQPHVIAFASDQGNYLTLKLDKTISIPVKIEIFDLKGVKLQENSISETTSIPVNLQTGVYILNIQSSNFQHTEKIIIR
ncbi:MAG: hypothetical protein PWQ06_2230 [Anaerophaga sp.]|nr:hypothetical protein [Anaerophaga sp.]